MFRTLLLTVAALAIGIYAANATVAHSKDNSTIINPPHQVVERFYNAYLAERNDTGTAMRNRLSDGSYRELPGLAPEFQDRIAELVDGPDPIRFDPFLCAQNWPDRVSVAKGETKLDRAAVGVTFFWLGSPSATEFTVLLRHADAGWLITDTTCGAARPRSLTATETVQCFYDLYLRACEQGNPLASGRFRDMPYLTENCVADIDHTLQTFDKSSYDPILCAQDIPEWILAVENDASQVGTAHVAVQSSLEGHHLDITLIQVSDQWLIETITDSH